MEKPDKPEHSRLNFGEHAGPHRGLIYTGGVPTPGSPEWHERVEKMLAEEATQPLRWWYLSFAGEEGFRGGAYIQARGMTLALKRCHALRINPGGQVLFLEVPEEAERLIPHDHKHRLLTKEELESEP